jgi:hypothetical protein
MKLQTKQRQAAQPNQGESGAENLTGKGTGNHEKISVLP